MATADRRPVALDVLGQVTVEMDGDSARVEALGDRIVVHLPGLLSGVSSLGRLSPARGRGGTIQGVHDGLEAAGLTLEVVAGGRRVGRLGVGARAGLASRVLGLGPLQVFLGAILGSFARRGGRQE